MAGTAKLKLLYLAQILSEETDEDHGLSLEEITKKLSEHGISPDRKTLYRDFEELREFGMDIQTEQQGRCTYYKLVSREFELAELKLLVTSVESCKFLTENKSKELIKKLEKLVSKYDAEQLQRQLVIAGRVKSMNQSVIYNVDDIHRAISDNRRISFQYFKWNENRELVRTHDGKKTYHVSPWALVWDDENYYLVGYSEEDGEIRHYRVDKMKYIHVEDKVPRSGQKLFQQEDLAKYSKGLFGMFRGEKVDVILEAENSFAGVMIDRFGKDVWMTPAGDGEHIHVRATVYDSTQFRGWIMSLGDGVRVLSPAKVVAEMQEDVRKLAATYGLALKEAEPQE